MNFGGLFEMQPTDDLIAIRSRPRTLEELIAIKTEAECKRADIVFRKQPLEERIRLEIEALELLKNEPTAESVAQKYKPIVIECELKYMQCQQEVHEKKRDLDDRQRELADREEKLQEFLRETKRLQLETQKIEEQYQEKQCEIGEIQQSGQQLIEESRSNIAMAHICRAKQKRKCEEITSLTTTVSEYTHCQLFQEGIILDAKSKIEVIKEKNRKHEPIETLSKTLQSTDVFSNELLEWLAKPRF